MPERMFVLNIKTETEEQKAALGAAIHEQLAGNPDYVNSNIILNIEDECLVKLIILKNATWIPDIAIPFTKVKYSLLG